MQQFKKNAGKVIINLKLSHSISFRRNHPACRLGHSGQVRIRNEVSFIIKRREHFSS